MSSNRPIPKQIQDKIESEAKEYADRLFPKSSADNEVIYRGFIAGSKANICKCLEYQDNVQREYYFHKLKKAANEVCKERTFWEPKENSILINNLSKLLDKIDREVHG